MSTQFSAKIDEGASKLLPCCQPECHELYPEDVVLDVVDEAYGEKYAKQVSLINSNLPTCARLEARDRP
jgi:hypothetical protein